MDIKKKILIGFLVSAGLYSLANAVRYVNNLPVQEKERLLSIIKKSTHAPILVGGGSVIGVKAGPRDLPA